MLAADRRICIVTSGHVGSAPRVVKEADALAAAGHEVHVVAADITPGVRPLDTAVEQRAQWTLHRVGRGSRVRWLAGRSFESLARVAWNLGVRSAGVAEASESRLIEPLATAATRVTPDIVIGHNLAGFAAAGRAAARVGCRLAFDAEDDHVGQHLPHEPGRSRRIDGIQRRLLARTVVATASSPLIADALSSRYGARPVLVLNSFERIEWSAGGDEQDGVLDLYWVSQTIGPDRGIENAFEVLAGLARPWRMDLRGHVDAAYRTALEALAATNNGRLRFLPTIDPAAVTASARGYRLGISSEIELDENKQRCLGNKIFHYLAAGTPVWLSDTPAQRAFAPRLGLAGVLLAKEPASASAQLESWLEHTRSNPRALREALEAAARTFDWSLQAAGLVAAYDAVLGDAA